jgi:hypothetical protein
MVASLKNFREGHKMSNAQDTNFSVENFVIQNRMDLLLASMLVADGELPINKLQFDDYITEKIHINTFDWYEYADVDYRIAKLVLSLQSDVIRFYNKLTGSRLTLNSFDRHPFLIVRCSYSKGSLDSITRISKVFYERILSDARALQEMTAGMAPEQKISMLLVVLAIVGVISIPRIFDSWSTHYARKREAELKQRELELKIKDSELKQCELELKNKDSELQRHELELKNKELELKNLEIVTMDNFFQTFLKNDERRSQIDEQLLQFLKKLAKSTDGTERILLKHAGKGIIVHDEGDATSVRELKKHLRNDSKF